MKSSSLIRTVALMLLPAAFALAAGDPMGYGDSRWGMDQEQVKRLHPAARINKNTLSMFNHRVIGKKADLTFFFTPDDHLAMVGIDFSNSHPEENQLVDSFEELRQLLVKKYGPEARPTKRIGHTNILDQRGPDALSKEIAIGHMSFIAFWDFPETTIELFLTGEKARIRLVLFYNSKLYDSDWENPWEKEKLGDL